jgi:hypothetical protein
MSPDGVSGEPLVDPAISIGNTDALETLERRWETT